MYNSERILKIGQYLAKLWTRVWCLVFLTHGVFLRTPVALVEKDPRRLIRKNDRCVFLERHTRGFRPRQARR